MYSLVPSYGTPKKSRAAASHRSENHLYWKELPRYETLLVSMNPKLGGT